MIQRILQIIMETEPDLARETFDANNAFGDLERPCIRAALEANVALHPLIPMYDVLHTKGMGEIWFYDEMGNLILSVLRRKGVRHGYVLGSSILCIAVRPIYDAILVILGPGGFLFNYADDVYLGGVSVNVALPLEATTCLYGMIGLSLAWGPRKTELELPPECDPGCLPLPRNASGKPLHAVVSGFKACLESPRHSTNYGSFVNEALQPIARRHGNLLDLVVDVADEEPFAALRLL